MATMSPTAPAAPRRTSTVRRNALLLTAGALVIAAATTVVALIAQALGAGDFPALKPAVYMSFAIAGFLAGYVGWRIVRARAARPTRALRLLVPLLLVVSLVPDVVLLVTGFIPGTTVAGVIALMLMHPIVVAVGVPLFQRIAPVAS
ncbi:DUF6069 family protein [Leifsonia sp. SIMBA_070]|uniref:DUF6069 family protein n=1 Tax=Leifsonia sp. SIMBA_070 TaxID=3085810 RepID=UPI003979D12A